MNNKNNKHENNNSSTKPIKTTPTNSAYVFYHLIITMRANERVKKKGYKKP